MHTFGERRFDLFVVYYRPLDYPSHWVVRRQSVVWNGLGPRIVNAPVASLCESLEEARNEIPEGMTHMIRESDDDPAIYEVWL
jgi:hypothetical protein